MPFLRNDIQEMIRGRGVGERINFTNEIYNFVGSYLRAACIDEHPTMREAAVNAILYGPTSEEDKIKIFRGMAATEKNENVLLTITEALEILEDNV